MIIVHSLVDKMESSVFVDPRYVSLRCLRQKSSFKSFVRCTDNLEKYFDVGDPENYGQLSLTCLRRLCPVPENIRALSFKQSEFSSIPYQVVFDLLSKVHCIEVQYESAVVVPEGFIYILRYAVELAENHADGVALSSAQMLGFDNLQFGSDDFNDLRASSSHIGRNESNRCHTWASPIAKVSVPTDYRYSKSSLDLCASSTTMS